MQKEPKKQIEEEKKASEKGPVDEKEMESVPDDEADGPEEEDVPQITFEDFAEMKNLKQARNFLMKFFKTNKPNMPMLVRQLPAIVDMALQFRAETIAKK